MSTKKYTGELLKKENCTFKQYENETQMLIAFWGKEIHDYVILTGWNIAVYDIPYLVYRSEVLQINLKNLLPLKYWSDKDYNIPVAKNSMFVSSVKIPGFVILDYMLLFMKFNQENRSSYSLDSISEEELKETKLNYDEYENLDDMYFRNFNKFIEYNIKDVELVYKLDKKFGYIDLALKLCYLCKTNLDEFWYPTKLWDIYMYNAFMDIKIVPPKSRIVNEYEKIEYPGGHVKTPVKGFSRWVVPFDVSSLYPNIIVSGNFSPLSIKNRVYKPLNDYIEIGDRKGYIKSVPANKDDNNGTGDVLDYKYSKFLFGEEQFPTNELKENNESLSIAGYYFDTSKQDVICKLVEDIFNQRKNYQKLLHSEKEKKDKGDKDLISLYTQMVYSLKIMINAFYGTFGNKYFRYYDTKISSSITLVGQYLIRKVANTLDLKLFEFAKSKNIPIKKKTFIKVIDTDSCYLILENFVDDFVSKTGKNDNESILKFIDQFCSNLIEPEIKNTIQSICTELNFFKNNLKMGREKICDSALSKDKRRYILSVVEDDGIILDERKMVIKGIDIVQSRTPKKIRKYLKELARFLMDNPDESKIKEKLQIYKEEYLKYNIENIAFPRSARNLEKYKPEIIENDTSFSYRWAPHTPIQIRGIWTYNLLLRKLKLDKKYRPLYKDGEKIRYIYLKEPNPIGENVIAIPDGINFPPEFGIETFVDKEECWNKSVISIMDGVTKSLGWDLTNNDKLSDWDF